MRTLPFAGQHALSCQDTTYPPARACSPKAKPGSRLACPARPNRSAVGADLRPVVTHLRRVEAHCDDRVAALRLRFFDHSVDHLLPAVGERLRHSLQLASEDRLQACAEL